jgi:hypothetical protein
MSGVDFDAVKRLVPMSAVLNLIGWQPSAVYRARQRGPCPVHGSSSPSSRSFEASPRVWYCYACKRGGGPLQLYAEVRKLSVYKAAVELCRVLKYRVPWLPRSKVRKPRQRNREEVP